jgi:hypothetical protein
MMRAVVNTALVHAILGIAAVTMLVASYARASDSIVELQRNPFDRPEAELLISNTATSNRGSTPESGPVLRAVLAAGSKSLVNFGGVILQIGESASGYRLLSVEEDGAIFSRDGEKVVFSLYKQEQAEDQ